MVKIRSHVRRSKRGRPHAVRSHSRRTERAILRDAGIIIVELRDGDAPIYLEA